MFITYSVRLSVFIFPYLFSIFFTWQSIQRPWTECIKSFLFWSEVSISLFIQYLFVSPLLQSFHSTHCKIPKKLGDYGHYISLMVLRMVLKYGVWGWEILLVLFNDDVMRYQQKVVWKKLLKYFLLKDNWETET